MVSPPIEPSDLDKKIEELGKKKVKFEKDGQKELEDEKANLMKNVEREVEAELEKERR